MSMQSPRESPIDEAEPSNPTEDAAAKHTEVASSIQSILSENYTISDALARLFESDLTEIDARQLLLTSIAEKVVDGQHLPRYAAYTAGINAEYPSVAREIVSEIARIGLNTENEEDDVRDRCGLFLVHLLHHKTISTLVMLEYLDVMVLRDWRKTAAFLLGTAHPLLMATERASLDHVLANLKGPKLALKACALRPVPINVGEDPKEIQIELDALVLPKQSNSKKQKVGTKINTLEKSVEVESAIETAHDSSAETPVRRKPSGPQMIEDLTNTEQTDLRKRIYLLMMSTMSAEETAHRLLRLDVAKRHPQEIINMLVESCGQERTFNRTYGNTANILSQVSRSWQEREEAAFADFYGRIHHFETNQIRNIGAFFGQLLAVGAIRWSIWRVVALNPDDSTPSNRILLKALLDELRQEVGISKMTQLFEDPLMQEYLEGVFPVNNLGSVRFAINFFTALKLGPLTDRMREHLTELEKS